MYFDVEEVTLSTGNCAHRTAIHEAAHAAVILSFGGDPEVYLWNTQHGQHLRWAGTCVVGDTSGFPGNWRPIVGMAGMLAELLMCTRFCAVEPAVAYSFLQASTISVTDNELMNGYTVLDVQQCLLILRDQWPVVEGIARQLLAHPLTYDPRN